MFYYDYATTVNTKTIFIPYIIIFLYHSHINPSVYNIKCNINLNSNRHQSHVTSTLETVNDEMRMLSSQGSVDINVL